MLLRNDHQQPCSGGGGWRKFIALIAQTAAAFRLPIALALLYLTLRYALYNQWVFFRFSAPNPDPFSGLNHILGLIFPSHHKVL